MIFYLEAVFQSHIPDLWKLGFACRTTPCTCCRCCVLSYRASRVTPWTPCRQDS